MQEARPRLTEGGPSRISRGGSREYATDVAPTGYSFRYLPESKFPGLGFRLARGINHEGERHEKEG